VLDECIPETVTRNAFGSASALTVGGIGIDQFFAEQPGWAARVAQQRLGGTAPGVPVLAYQGQFDPWVPHAVTEQLADDWCAEGANVRFTTYPLAEHFAALVEGIPQVVTWIRSRFANQPATPTC
jgi:pimeloyl-ACP methyl ester carboxylesterase